jgi:hypothetical protein
MIWENAAKINVGEWPISLDPGALLLGLRVGVYPAARQGS